MKYKVCDKKGNIYKICDSKNQAMKFKKEMKDKGCIIPLTIVEVEEC